MNKDVVNNVTTVDVAIEIPPTQDQQMSPHLLNLDSTCTNKSDIKYTYDKGKVKPTTKERSN